MASENSIDKDLLGQSVTSLIQYNNKQAKTRLENSGKLDLLGESSAAVYLQVKYSKCSMNEAFSELLEDIVM